MDGKQERFKHEKAIDSGIDEDGKAFEIIPLSMVLGGELQPRTVYTKPVRHIVNDSSPTPRGWYKDKHEPSGRRPRPCYTEALLTTPYAGWCHINCNFCYVGHGTRGYRATGLPTANPNYPDTMRKQIAKMLVSGAAYISSFTEPFQLLENEYHITQRLAQVFIDNVLPIFFLSRLNPPDWAVNALLQNPYSYMQWSINTSNPSQFNKMSPGAMKLDKLYKRMDELSDQGVYISIQCNPVLPGIVSLEELKQLIRIGAGVGMRHIIFKFAEQVFNNRKMLMERLSHVPGVEEFDSVMTQRIGGVYTVDEVLRREWLDELLAETRACGVTMSTCYEYYDNGAAGDNLAPWYTTSRGGCHGKSAPMHYRPEPGARFQPLQGCFESGCLYCEEYGTKVCGNARLLSAPMLTYADYKSIQLAGSDSNWKLPTSAPDPDSSWDFDYWYPGQQTFAEYYRW